jgi:hypothetical protein
LDIFAANESGIHKKRLPRALHHRRRHRGHLRPRTGDRRCLDEIRHQPRARKKRTEYHADIQSHAGSGEPIVFAGGVQEAGNERVSD